MDRRKFLLDASYILMFAVSFGTAGWCGYSYLMPPMKPPKFRKILLASVRQIPSNTSFIAQGILGNKIIVVEDKGTYRAFSGQCPHLGCSIYWREQERDFFCPCHNGYFTKEGKVVSGPPPRPLTEFKIEVEDESIFVYVEDKEQSV